MADYQLTQTGQEVQDILDSLGATYFFSQVCSTWVSDNTYPDYPYKGTISLVGIDGTMGVEVSFGNTEAISGNYSPICNTVNDAVEIWSKVNDTITIPTIKIYKNGYVNLSGSSNYMPQSGGNFTGAISVNADPVVLVSQLPSDLLWTNPSPSSDFTSQTVALDLSGYKFVVIVCRTASNRDHLFSSVCSVGAETYPQRLLATDFYLRGRHCNVSATGVWFNQGFYYPTYGTDSASVSNAQVIPYKIYGIK